MATAPLQDEHDAALEEQDTASKRLAEVHERALKRFDLSVLPQMEQRGLCLTARRFVNIPGAMWEGDFGETFPDEIKLEIPLVKEGIDKIKRDYNENRIVPDFRPAGGKGDEESAQTLDGLHRADSHCFKSQEARDNAFAEAVDGGFGAYRLTNEWADPYDKDSDHQRINPGLIITDADQRVFFGPSERYDKSDAPYAFVITGHDRDLFEEDHKDAISSWDVPTEPGQYDWFAPDVVKVAEYYEVEDSDEKLFVCTQTISGEQQRFWETEIDPDELDEMKRSGWRIQTRKLKRKRIHKYVMSGAEVLKDQGLIAGDCIPIVPVYGKRSMVDGIERFEGYTQSRMDVQRLYNMAVSKLAETSAQSPREIPIFAAQQMPPHLANLWSKQVVDRHAYALVEPLLDGDGKMVAAGPIGKVEAPQIDQATQVVLQVARTDLTASQDDGADEVKANTSADALEVAATRVDAKSGIYLDNMRQSVQREGEIYLSMCADIYYEPGREVETMSEDGSDGTSTLVQAFVDGTGKAGYQNDFTRGHYKVIADVTEATATRRDKTVKSCLHTASVATELGDQELAQAALITAVANQDGEGMTELQKFARRKGIQLGLIEPDEEEQAALEKAAEESQEKPDPAAEVLAAQAEDLKASAAKKSAEIPLTQAKTAETLIKAKLSPFQQLGKMLGGGQRQPTQQ